MDYTTEAILEGINSSDTKILNYIYKKFFPSIRLFIERNSGTEEDARDLFQEAIIVVYKKLKKEPIVLNCNFKTYIYSICRLLWLKHLNRNKSSLEIVSDKVLEHSDDDVEDVYYQTEKYRLYQKHFNDLGEDCKKVLQLSLKKVSLKDIAKILGYKSEKYAKKKKYQCKQTLISKIKSDNEYKDLYDG